MGSSRTSGMIADIFKPNHSEGRVYLELDLIGGQTISNGRYNAVR